MIDYEKLKEAWELCNKLAETSYVVEFVHQGNYIEFSITDCESEDGLPYLITADIDELLCELKQLTQPQPKYKIGDEVWFYAGNQTYSFVIEEIYLADNEYVVASHSWHMPEQYVYSSKEQLIDDQIKCWQKMKNEL